MIIKLAFIVLLILIIAAFILARLPYFARQNVVAPPTIKGRGEPKIIEWPKTECYSKDLIKECMQYVKKHKRRSGQNGPVTFTNGTMSARALNIMDRMENSYSQPYWVNKVIRQESEDYEVVVGKYLTSHGLTFLTENDIRRLNADGKMESSLTPDFLFKKPIIIKYDGKEYKVNWIDAKDYGCWDSRLVTKKVQDQVDKYNATFGPGALVYSCGIMCDHSIQQTLILTLLTLCGSPSGIHGASTAVFPKSNYPSYTS